MGIRFPFRRMVCNLVDTRCLGSKTGSWNKMKGINHERLSFLILLFFLIVLFHFNIKFNIFQLVLFWMLQTLYVNCDLDARHSRSKNRIGYFKYLFYFTKHRGVMHNPALWMFIFIGSWHIGYMWCGTGLLFSAMIHIFSDSIS